MKHDTNKKPSNQKQKWFLSALLFAALGSNYYFQTTSKNAGLLNMASNAENESGTAAHNAKADGASFQKSAVQGKVTTDCKDCITMTAAEFNNLKILAQKVAAQETEAKKETPEEKRNRIKDENLNKEKVKREKEKEKKDAEKEKLIEQKKARTEEFKEKMAEAAKECKGDVECSTNEMVSLLQDYTGDSKIEPKDVKAAFNQYIAKDLNAALRDPEQAGVLLQALIQINSDIPAEYRSLKEKTNDIIKTDSMRKGLEINSNFKMADLLTKAKRPTEAYNYLMMAKQQEASLIYSSDKMIGASLFGSQQAHDLATMDYIRRNYIPDFTKMLSSLANLNGVDTGSSATTTASTTINKPSETTATTRTNTRSETLSDRNVKTQNDDDVLNGVKFGKKTPNQRINRTAVTQ